MNITIDFCIFELAWEFKQTILIIWSKLTQKRYFQSNEENKDYLLRSFTKINFYGGRQKNLNGF